MPGQQRVDRGGLEQRVVAARGAQLRVAEQVDPQGVKKGLLAHEPPVLIPSGLDPGVEPLDPLARQAGGSQASPK